MKIFKLYAYITLFAVLLACLPGCEKRAQNRPGTATSKASSGSGAPKKTTTYPQVPYQKLASPAFVSDYAGNGVSFEAMFFGEFSLTTVYSQSGIDVDDRVFINHRDVTFDGSQFIDSELPGFVLSISKFQSDIIYEMKRGDIIKVRGLASKVKTPGKETLHIVIHQIEKTPTQ